MRGFVRQGNVFYLKPEAAGVEKKSGEIDVDPMDLHVAANGPTAAGWLIGKHRRQLHRSGRILFNIPTEKESPPWFRVAIETLKRRKGWIVDVSTNRSGIRSYLVTWEAWAIYSKRGQALNLIGPSGIS